MMKSLVGSGGRKLSLMFATLMVLVAQVCLIGCLHDGKRGDYVTVPLPLASYARSLTGNKPGHFSIDFPVLEVYDKLGRSIYRGTDPGKNVTVLQSLPSRIVRTIPPEVHPSLNESLAGLSESGLKKRDSAAPAKFTVVSVGLSGCGDCAKQEEAILRERDRLLRRGIDIFVLQVAQ